MNSSLRILKFSRNSKIPYRDPPVKLGDDRKRDPQKGNSKIPRNSKCNSNLGILEFLSAYIFSNLIASLSMMPIPRFSVFFAISCASYKECIL